MTSESAAMFRGGETTRELGGIIVVDPVASDGAI